MTSLRARLTAGLLVLSATGLLLLAGVTYVTQRSFLRDRVDVQARAAVPAVGRALSARGIGGPAGRDPSAGPGSGDAGGPPPPAEGGATERPPSVEGEATEPPPPAERDGPGSPFDDRGPPGDDDDEGPGGPRRSGPGVELPPGTYGQRRDAAGRVLGDVVLSYGRGDLPAPALPRAVAVEQLLTVDSVAGDGVRYRAIALPSPGGDGVTVAAVPLRELDRTLDRLLLVEGLVIAVVLGALGTLSWLLVRVGLRPLDRIGRTAGAIAGGDLSRRVEPTTTRTEVGRLGLALNAMLDRLEEAFAERRASEERLRRFLADASHELRTPLASVRGYAELLRMGAAADPADVDKATRRIESEAARMGVLVEDLLTLARLDELDAPARTEVDLVEVARDAVDDARAADPGRPIELRAEGPAPVLGDPNQLRQVAGNLTANALAHTPAGTAVEVTVSTAGDEVELAVRDHGPGLPGGDPDALFERFWRSERGRERGRGGAGLGLAIVAGIAHAHGGSVRAGDAEGGGARFVVKLPGHLPARSQEPPRSPAETDLSANEEERVP